MLFLLKLFASKKASQAVSNTTSYDAPSTHSLRPASLILNFLRLCNITSILLAMAAEILMVGLTKTSLTGFWIFDVWTHISSVIFALFLLLAEIPGAKLIPGSKWLRKYYLRNWPLFSVNASFYTFGPCMMFLGGMILANISNGGDDNWNGSIALQPIATGAGLLCIIFGTIAIPLVPILALVAKFRSKDTNPPQGFLLRDKLTKIPARLIREYGNAAVKHHEECIANKLAQDNASHVSEKRSADLPRYASNAESAYGSYVAKPARAASRATSHGSSRPTYTPHLPVNVSERGPSPKPAPVPAPAPVQTDNDDIYTFQGARQKYSSSFYGSEYPLSGGPSSYHGDNETNGGRDGDVPPMPNIPDVHRQPSYSAKTDVWGRSVSQVRGRPETRDNHC